MTRPVPLRRLAVLALLALAACAPPPAPDIRSQISRAQVDRSPVPLLLAEVPELRVAATLAPRGNREGVATWRTADDVALSFREGVLVATRGLGDDLISADVAGTLAALEGGPQTGYSRLLTLLDGEGRTTFRAFVCEMSPPQTERIAVLGAAFDTQRQDESCFSTGLRVDNSYWRDADGTMRRARQWVSPIAGYLTTERLTRPGADENEGR